MKQLTKIAASLIATLAFSANVEVLCQSTTTPNTPTRETYKGRLDRHSHGKKHRIPSAVYLEFEYTFSGIFVYPSQTYTEYNVSVQGQDRDIEATLSPEEGYFVETGALYGEYTITAATPDGAVFTGTLIAE